MKHIKWLLFILAPTLNIAGIWLLIYSMQTCALWEGRMPATSAATYAALIGLSLFMLFCGFVSGGAWLTIVTETEP